MRTHRSGTLPPDLKTLSTTSRHEEIRETLEAIATLIAMAAVFLLVMFAAVPPEPFDYPVVVEEVRR